MLHGMVCAEEHLAGVMLSMKKARGYLEVWIGGIV